jgi:hypothetical protein
MPYKNPNNCLSEKYFAQKDQDALAAENSTTKRLFNLTTSSAVDGELYEENDLASLFSEITGSLFNGPLETEQEMSYLNNLPGWDWESFGQALLKNEELLKNGVDTKDLDSLAMISQDDMSKGISEVIDNFMNFASQKIPKDEKDFNAIYNSSHVN